MGSISDLRDLVRDHRCFSHPIFDHWAAVEPAPEVVGALVHQIQLFCASTRTGGKLPEALKTLDLSEESHLLQEIVESEENHGPELATMAGFILNRAADREICPDLADQRAVEDTLREYSDGLLGSLPGYDSVTGLTTQARRAIAVFERRNLSDRETTFKNLGTALALEMISNRHLIPGEKRCLVDSGIYGATLRDPEMHYLLEHWGECGAEEQHEKNAMAAVASVLDDETGPLIRQGALDFLESLTALWDVLDASLLQSGFTEAGQPEERDAVAVGK